MELFEKTLRETTLYDGKILRLHVDDVELPNGNTAIREIVEHSGGVCVAALSERGTLRFVRQSRECCPEALVSRGVSQVTDIDIHHFILVSFFVNLASAPTSAQFLVRSLLLSAPQVKHDAKKD